MGDEPQPRADKEANTTKVLAKEFRTVECWQIATNVVLAVVGVAVALIYYCQLQTMLKQLQGLRDEISMSHPPKLRLTNVTLAPVGLYTNPVSLRSGDMLHGEVAVINTGAQPALIDGSDCIVYWHLPPLPMYAPYFYNTRGFVKAGELVKCSPDSSRGIKMPGQGTANPAPILKSGDIAFWEFETKVPLQYNADTVLYVMGFVQFHDRLTAASHRFVRFARQYDFNKQMFVKVDNPDYESQDYEEPK